MNRMMRGCGVLLMLAAATARGGEGTMGYRGDGTGKYPHASPPVTWGRISSTITALRFTTAKPVEGEAGTPMPDGVIRDWLILGPVPTNNATPNDAEILPGELSLAPESGQAAADQKWRKVTLDSAYLDFNQLIGKPTSKDVAAFAFANVFSPTGGAFRMHLTCISGGRLYVNGKKPVAMGGRANVELTKGWNRLLMRVSPGDKDWYAVPVLMARGPVPYQEKNILWRTPLPGVQPAFYGGGTGVGSPVLVGDRMYLQSEPQDLICLNKTDGKVLWLRRASYFEAATDEEKKLPPYAEAQAIAQKIDVLNATFVSGQATPDQLQEKLKLDRSLQKQMKQVNPAKFVSGPVPDVGFSGFTPSTDGKSIYTWFGDGVSACFSVEGERRWVQVAQSAPEEHGFSSSPLLIDQKFVVFTRDLIAFDCETGKLLWQTPIVSPTGLNPANFTHGSLVGASIAGTKTIMLGNQMIVRAGDGKLLHQEKGNHQGVPTPVCEGNRAYFVTKGNLNLTVATLPEVITEPLRLTQRELTVGTSAYPKHYLPWHLSSPLVHEGLAYLVNNAGVLSVVDVETGQVAYQRMLDLDVLQGHNEGAARGIGISPVLAGGHIYLMGNNGTTLVIEPGRTYRQLAKNRIESVTLPGHWSERQERFMANPVPDGQRIYLRGEDAVYAIGER